MSWLLDYANGDLDPSPPPGRFRQWLRRRKRRPAPQVAAQIFWYSLATVVVSLLLWPVTPTGWLYPAAAGLFGAVLLWEAAQLWRRARSGLEVAQLKAMRLFHWSNTYLALVFLAVALDPLLT